MTDEELDAWLLRLTNAETYDEKMEVLREMVDGVV